jgi:superfamily II DNA or RNA helicase
MLRLVQSSVVDYPRGALGRVRRVLLVLPTCAGKTHSAAEFVARDYRTVRRVLVLVHPREIAMDSARRMRAFSISCGVNMADEPETDARVQGLRGQAAVARSLVHTADFLIWDECQQVVTGTWRAIAVQHFGAFHVGLAATPMRGDLRGLADAFGEMVTCSASAALADPGVLALCRVVGLAKPQSQISAWMRYGVGHPVAFELKAAGSYTKTTQAALQVQFLRLVRGAEGDRGIERSVADALAAVQRAKVGGAE